MTSNNQEYSVDQEIDDFFGKTSATRAACDARAQELVGGVVTPVAVQGACSYSVYAGPDDGFVVQFRLKSLELRTEITRLAQEIYGPWAPQVTEHGEIGQPSGQDTDSKEPLSVYVLSRVPGVSHLDFILASLYEENSPEMSVWRKKLMADFARLFALSWKSPQPVGESLSQKMFLRYERDLRLLLTSLPTRFRPMIQASLDSLLEILTLPMVLLHKDFGTCNIMVDAKTGELTGVIDWAEAEIGPFGLNLYSLQAQMGKFHLKKGWIRYEDYHVLEQTFWDTLCAEVGGISAETMRAIKSAQVLGLLLSHGFTSRLANMPEPVPIRDDEDGAYDMLGLDGLLVNPATRIV